METTNLSNLKINVLAKEQYDAAEKDENQIYLITTNALGGYLELAGGTLIGQLILAGDPTQNLEAVTKQYVDNKYSTETWTFELEDGSTITKSVVIA